MRDHLRRNLRHRQSFVKAAQFRKASEFLSYLLAAVPPASAFFVLQLIVVALTQGFLRSLLLPGLLRLIQFELMRHHHQVPSLRPALFLVAHAIQPIFSFWTLHYADLVGFYGLRVDVELPPRDLELEFWILSEPGLVEVQLLDAYLALLDVVVRHK